MRAQTQLLSLPNLEALISSSLIGKSTSDAVSDSSHGVTVMPFVPTIPSGGFADIGPRRFMEDEHIMMDDLAMHMGSLFRCPKPSAFYGVFEGHGGPEPAAYVGKNGMRIFFNDAGFPESCDMDELFLGGVEKYISRTFLLADVALADECTISSSSETTALTALVLGRLFLVANAGDCRAVLCRKEEAIEMSEDHRPTTASEKTRVEEMGGYVEDGYLNGILSVSRALGDWDMKLPKGTASTLIAEPEVRQIILTEDDEFLIIGCDGIWDVMSSQQAVRVVRRELRRHGDPQQSAKELVREALTLNTFDNLTVVGVCFSSSPDLQQVQRFKCSLSSEALTTRQNMLDARAVQMRVWIGHGPAMKKKVAL